MDIASITQSIYDWPLSASIREVGIFFPALEALHVIGISLVLGTIVIVDLRLVGYPSHRPSALRLVKELLPFTWAAFALAVTTGLLMFASKAIDYAANPVFLSKMVVLALAGFNMTVFHLGVYRRIDQWDVGAPPLSARIAGLSSLSLWILVVFLGRWVGFV